MLGLHMNVCVNMRALFNCMVFFQTHSWHKQAACLMDEKSRLKTICHFWLHCLCSNHITCLLIPLSLTWVLVVINFNRFIYGLYKVATRLKCEGRNRIPIICPSVKLSTYSVGRPTVGLLVDIIVAVLSVLRSVFHAKITGNTQIHIHCH